MIHRGTANTSSAEVGGPGHRRRVLRRTWFGECGRTGCHGQARRGHPSAVEEDMPAPSARAWHAPGSGDRVATFGYRRGAAFTLVEMLVVMAIAIIALTIVLPSATALWNQRKIADAENTIQGLLMTARAGALRSGGVDAGIFFYVDESGTQHVVSIEQDVEGRLDCGQDSACLAAWENVFRITGQRRQRMPKPMRAVPRYVIDDDNDPNISAVEAFSAEELANNSFDRPIGTPNQAQRHRNFFTMVYSGSGRLLIRRDVLIRDDDLDGDRRGDNTGLEVGDGLSLPEIEEYYSQDDTVTSISPSGNKQGVPFLIGYKDTGNRVAINFPSVDGVIVYDDAVFNGLGSGEEKREYLLREGLPFYVSRVTGEVIRGPSGEIIP